MNRTALTRRKRRTPQIGLRPGFHAKDQGSAEHHRYRIVHKEIHGELVPVKVFDPIVPSKPEVNRHFIRAKPGVRHAPFANSVQMEREGG